MGPGQCTTAYFHLDINCHIILRIFLNRLPSYLFFWPIISAFPLDIQKNYISVFWTSLLWLLRKDLSRISSESLYFILTSNITVKNEQKASQYDTRILLHFNTKPWCQWSCSFTILARILFWLTIYRNFSRAVMCQLLCRESTLYIDSEYGWFNCHLWP